jgi:arylsulfatase A
LPHTYITLADRSPGKDGTSVKYFESKTRLALFDLERDIGETKNVAREHPEEVRRLRALAEKARIELGDSATYQEGKGVRPAGRE